MYRGIVLLNGRRYSVYRRTAVTATTEGSLQMQPPVLEDELWKMSRKGQKRGQPSVEMAMDVM